MLLDELTAEQLEEQAEELQRRGFHPGYDGMSAQAALWFRLNAGTLLRQLKRERYVPSPVVGFHVAKQDGSFRPLVRPEEDGVRIYAFPSFRGASVDCLGRTEERPDRLL